MMKMDDRIDYSTLNWVKEEIDETLNQARHALEEYVENPEDTTQLRFCLTYIHQVYGTLQMVELYGAALFAEEMEQLTLSLLNNEVTQKEDAYEVLMRSILQLPDYLERIQTGLRDDPLILLPLLNDLRAARGTNLLSENALFAPDIATAPPIVIENRPPECIGVNVQQVVRQLRHPYQVGLLSWYREDDPIRGLQKMSAVLTKLEQVCTHDKILRIWWVANGVIEALIDRGLESSVSVKKLIGQVDRKIKAVIDQGEQLEDSSTKLLKNLLYYVANSTSDGPRVRAIREKFNLDTAIQNKEEIDTARESIAGPNLQLMRTVSEAIRDDLESVKDAFDLFLRNSDRKTSDLEMQVETLNKTADTLGMLGLGVPRKIVQDQVGIVNRMLQGHEEPSEAKLMEIASALLYVESSLEGMIERGAAEMVSQIQEVATAGDMQRDKPRLPDTEYQQIQDLVLKEISVDIAKAKDAIVSFIDAPLDHEQLHDVPRLFSQAIGGMRIIDIEHAAKLLATVNEYIATELIERQAEPAQEDLENLADAISSIEYYLEAIREKRPRKDFILAITHESLAKLGYAVEVPEQVQREHDTEVASPAVPDFQSLAEAEPERAGEEMAADAAAAPASVNTESTGAAAEEVPAVEAPAEEPVQSAPVAVVEAQIEDDLDEDIVDIFIEEAEEEQGVINELLPAWRLKPEDQEPLTRIRRAFHTLKGSGRMVGANSIGELAWSIENMLNRVLDETITTSPEMFDLIDQVMGVLPRMVGNLQNSDAPAEDVQALIDRAFEIVEIEKAAAQAGEEDTVDEAAPPRELPQVGAADTVYLPMDGTLYDIFTKESEAHLANIHKFIERCRAQSSPCVINDVIVRALHTLHGSARMAGAKPIAEVAGALEKYVKILMENETDLPAEGMVVLVQGVERIEQMLDKINGVNVDDVVIDDVAEKLATLYSVEAERKNETPVPAPVQAVAEEPQTPGYDEEILEVFLDEGTEILDSSEAIMQRWRDDYGNKEIVEELQRELHTLKGGARMANVSAMGDLSHRVESVLTLLVEGQREADEPTVELLHRCIDRLAVMLQQTTERQALEPATDLLEALDRLRGVAVPEPAAAEAEAAPAAAEDAPAGAEALQESAAVVSFPGAQPAEPAATEAPAIEPAAIEPDGAQALEADADQADDEEDSRLFEQMAELPLPHIPERAAPELRRPVPAGELPKQAAQGSGELVRVRADILDNMVNFAGEVSIFRSRLEQQNNTCRFNLTELAQTVDRLRSQLRQLEIETETQIIYRYEHDQDQYDENFDPLEMDRYSLIQQLSRALVETVSDITSIQALLDNVVRESDTLLLQQSRVNTELQEGLMRTRMVAFSGLVPRMRRIVRQTCSELGKKAELHVYGEHGEMDRTVLERITAPLEHMLRNAISHGIEAPDQRLNADKPEAGSISLSVAREGAEVVIVVSDDGRGLDLEAIRQKAVERGLMAENSDLTDNDIMQFVLESGLSTAQEVTQISGRGVGMDVVNSEIKQLGGSLHIDSRSQRGTTFTIRLPFTLAVNHALLVSSAEEQYALPLTSIEGIVRLTRPELSDYFENPQSRYQYAGVEYQVQSLNYILGNRADPLASDAKVFPVLLVRSGDHRMALQVDSLMGSREIVVKSVGPQLSTVRGISGATILGDGRVVLILDMGALVRMGATQRPMSIEPVAEPKVEDQGVTVMVVDDSITVRKVTTRLLERNNMQVVTAKDGVDAISLLQERMPDIMLLDIEMPRMDGFEFASYVRNDPKFRHIPIIMITSRTGQKHRDRATEIGVNRYLGKPYQEVDLLENIQALLGGTE